MHTNCGNKPTVMYRFLQELNNNLEAVEDIMSVNFSLTPITFTPATTLLIRYFQKSLSDGSPKRFTRIFK